MGTNGSGDYIKSLVKKREKNLPPKPEDPEAKKKEWMRLAAAFSRA